MDIKTFEKYNNRRGIRMARFVSYNQILFPYVYYVQQQILSVIIFPETSQIRKNCSSRDTNQFYIFDTFLRTLSGTSPSLVDFFREKVS